MAITFLVRVTERENPEKTCKRCDVFVSFYFCISQEKRKRYGNFSFII